MAFIFIAPFVFVVLTSFMTSSQALTSNLWPTSWHPENFVEIFTKLPMFDYLLNTMTYALLATGFMLLSSIPAAYALAKRQTPLARALEELLVMPVAVPGLATALALIITYGGAGGFRNGPADAHLSNSGMAIGSPGQGLRRGRALATQSASRQR